MITCSSRKINPTRSTWQGTICSGSMLGWTEKTRWFAPQNTPITKSNQNCTAAHRFWDQNKGRVSGLGITLYLYIIKKGDFTKECNQQFKLNPATSRWQIHPPWKFWLPGTRYRSVMDFKPAVTEKAIIVFINTLLRKSFVIQIRHPKNPTTQFPRNSEGVPPIFETHSPKARFGLP